MTKLPETKRNRSADQSPPPLTESDWTALVEARRREFLGSCTGLLIERPWTRFGYPTEGTSSELARFWTCLRRRGGRLSCPRVLTPKWVLGPWPNFSGRLLT